TAVLFAMGERWGLIAGAVALQLAFMLDCVDGQLSRYTRQFSNFGAWLDSVFDRAKEYVAYAGLAVGAAVGFDTDVWALAVAARWLHGRGGVSVGPPGCAGCSSGSGSGVSRRWLRPGAAWASVPAPGPARGPGPACRLAAPPPSSRSPLPSGSSSRASASGF